MDDILTVFPEIAEIDDPELRTAVRDCWLTACEDVGVKSLSTVPWFPPAQRKLGIEGTTLVEHVRDAVATSMALAEALDSSRSVDIDHDLVRAGALVHDVSKLYEFDGMEATPVYELLGHPYYGLYCVTRVGLPVEYAHIVLSHTSRTPVEPAFLEAELIKCSDEAAASAIRATAVDDLRDA